MALLEEALATLPAGDSSLRAEVRARVGTETYYDADLTKSDGLTRDALAMAKRVGDIPVVAYATTARHLAFQRPDVAPEDRIELAGEAIALTEAAPPSDVLAFALLERMVDLTSWVVDGNSTRRLGALNE